MNYDKRCHYRVILKDFDWRIKLCKLQNCEPTFCPKVKENCPIYSKEYNTDTSARHSEMNDDIVQTTSKEEDVESWNKESMR